MSDEGVPAWAEAMEHRIITELGKAIADSGAGVRAEMDRRFDQVDRRFDQLHDDITVVMARADRAHNRVDQEHEEVGALRAEMSRLWSRLRAIEQRLGLNGGDQGGKRP